jgi:hypothetical protein
MFGTAIPISAAVAAPSSAVTVLSTFSRVSVPTISGALASGATVTASVSAYSPAATSYRYAWKINGKDVVNGSGKTYAITSRDAGKTIAVVVSGSRAGYQSAAKTSTSHRIAGTADYTTPVAASSPTPAPSTSSPSGPLAAPAASLPAAAAPAPAPAATWLSGASGAGTSDDSFGTWRGTSEQITGTWSDNDANMVQFWPMQSGGALANWTKPVDVAIGAFDSGESWAAGSTGAYDSRWITSLKKLASLRAGRGTTYIRFAHEMNGNWYPWSVNTTNYVAFDAAWKRFRALQLTYFPAAKLVFSVNRESVGTGMDWRSFFPGSAYVDVMSVDYYNQYPYAGTVTDWNNSVSAVDAYKAPKGIAQHLAFAKSVGLPLAVSEWANMSTTGDSPVFVTQMHDFFAAHAGTGPGELVYDIYFNVDQNAGNFMIYGSKAKMPASAAQYRTDF